MIVDKFRVQTRIHVYSRDEVDEETEKQFTHWALVVDYFNSGDLENIKKSVVYDLIDDGHGYQQVIHRDFNRYWDMSESGADLWTLYGGKHRWVENMYTIEEFGRAWTERKHWYNSVTEDTGLFVAELLHHLNVVYCMPLLKAKASEEGGDVVQSRTYFSHYVFRHMKTYIMENKGFFLRIAKTLSSKLEKNFQQMFQDCGEEFIAGLAKAVGDEIANRLVAEEIDMLTPMYLLRVAATTLAGTLSRFLNGARSSSMEPPESDIPPEVHQEPGEADTEDEYEDDVFPTNSQLKKFADCVAKSLGGQEKLRTTKGRGRVFTRDRISFQHDEIFYLASEVFALIIKLLLEKKYGQEFASQFEENEMTRLAEYVAPWFAIAKKFNITWIEYTQELWDPFTSNVDASADDGADADAETEVTTEAEQQVEAEVADSAAEQEDSGVTVEAAEDVQPAVAEDAAPKEDANEDNADQAAKDAEDSNDVAVKEEAAEAPVPDTEAEKDVSDNAEQDADTAAADVVEDGNVEATEEVTKTQDEANPEVVEEASEADKPDENTE